MPLLQAKRSAGNYIYALWDAREPLEWFEERVTLYASEYDEIAALHPEMRKDWFATRFLIQLLSGHPERPYCLKDALGKPSLKDSPFTVSISHSRELCAVILGHGPVGIDIQRWDARMEQIAERFASAEELGCLSTGTRFAELHVLWGAKEALYKAYGLRKLDFKKQIVCAPFQYGPGEGELIGSLHLPDRKAQEFLLRYKAFQDGMLVYALPLTDL